MPEGTSETSISKKSPNNLLLGTIVAVLVLAGMFFFLFNPSTQGNVVLNPSDDEPQTQQPILTGNPELTVYDPTINDIGRFDSDVIDPADYANRELFFVKCTNQEEILIKFLKKLHNFLARTLKV